METIIMGVSQWRLNLLVIYYSSYGTNYQLAKKAAETAEKLGAGTASEGRNSTFRVVESVPGWKAHRDATAHIQKLGQMMLHGQMLSFQHTNPLWGSCFSDAGIHRHAWWDLGPRDKPLTRL